MMELIGNLNMSNNSDSSCKFEILTELNNQVLITDEDSSAY